MFSSDDLGDVNGTSVSWVVKYVVGKSLMLSVADAHNEDIEGWSGPVSIVHSSSSLLTDFTFRCQLRAAPILPA